MHVFPSGFVFTSIEGLHCRWVNTPEYTGSYPANSLPGVHRLYKTVVSHITCKKVSKYHPRFDNQPNQKSRSWKITKWRTTKSREGLETSWIWLKWQPKWKISGVTLRSNMAAVCIRKLRVCSSLLRQCCSSWKDVMHNNVYVLSGIMR